MRISILFLASFFALMGCEKNEKVANKPPVPSVERVSVQSILIAFEGSLPGKELSRSREEAEALAQSVFKEAQKPGADFRQLVIAHSDDMVPGIYKLVRGKEDLGPDEFPSTEFHSGFSDKAFSLQVEEIGFVAYHKKTSAYGYYILKRLE